MKRSVLNIDCYGHRTAKSLDVTCEQTQLRFRFEDGKSEAMRYHLGLFLDYFATTGRSYLRYPKRLRIAVLSEPNTSVPFFEDVNLCNRFAMVLTHDARLLERGFPYRELVFGTNWLGDDSLERRDYNKIRLVSMIGAHHQNPVAGHVLRNEVIARLANRSGVDRFGKGVKWIDSKMDGLADYAFSIAMENCSRDAYFSEKIIDCLLTETVPIYYGCDGIHRYFDKRGLISFQSVDELESILDSLSWQRYEQMRPFVLQNRDRAISQKWATRPQLYERIAAEILDHYGCLNRHASPTLFRIAQDVRHRMRRVSRSPRDRK